MDVFNFQSKNIIILFKSFVLGGAEKQGLFLANYLQNKKDCKVFIYSYLKSTNSKLFYQECEKYQLKNLFIVSNPLSAAGSLKYLKRRTKIALFGLKLRKHNPDIIIPYLNPPSIIAALYFKIAGAKITFWHHRGADYFRNNKLEKVAAQKVPFLIANSPDGKQELLKVLKTPIQKTYFLPNFSTIKSINPNKNIEVLNQVKGKTFIGMVAHFRIEKYQLLLVKAFHKIIKNHKDCHLILCGNIYESEDELSNFDGVYEYIQKNKLNNDITILHNVSANDILPYLDIGVLVSAKEGMPNVVMEYMAYSLPVVCTNHAGCISLLGENYPFYVENSLESIFYKLELLIKDQQLCKQTGIENHILLNNKFLIESYLNQLSDLINKYY